MSQSRAANSTFKVPVMFDSLDLIGSLMLRGTLGSAASWNT